MKHRFPLAPHWPGKSGGEEKGVTSVLSRVSTVALALEGVSDRFLI